VKVLQMLKQIGPGILRGSESAGRGLISHLSFSFIKDGPTMRKAIIEECPEGRRSVGEGF